MYEASCRNTWWIKVHRKSCRKSYTNLLCMIYPLGDLV